MKLSKKQWGAILGAITTAILAIAAALGLSGCAGVARDYVEADRLTHDAIAPEYLDMVRNAQRKAPDGTVAPWFGADDIKTREGTVASWDYRVTQAEKQLDKEGK
jgi:hypothetical protein